MNRPYTTYSTEPRPWRARPVDGSNGSDDAAEDYDAYGDYADYDYDDYDDDDDDIYEYVEPMDRRWMWVAGVAGAILLVAVICTVVILGGGDSGSVSATVGPPAATTSAPAPATTSAAPRTAASTPAAPTPSQTLPPETVTSVTPTQSAPAAVPPPPPAAALPGTVTYQVTGTRQLFDLVTIIYTDNQGALQTDVNVALPWTKQVVLDPGVTLTSVTATSLTGQLNCSITDATGALIAAQSNNTLITTCTK